MLQRRRGQRCVPWLARHSECEAEGSKDSLASHPKVIPVPWVQHCESYAASIPGSSGEKQREGREMVRQSMGAAIEATLSEEPGVAGMCIDTAPLGSTLPAVAGLLREEGHNYRKAPRMDRRNNFDIVAHRRSFT